MEIGLSQGFFGFIYFDPSDEELIHVAKQPFDTLRMGIHSEKGKDFLCFGNGYGTTHSSVSAAMGELNPRLKLSPRDGRKYEGLNGGALILYFDRNQIFINAECWSMSEQAKPEEVLSFLKEPAKGQLRELIRLLRENQL